MAQHFSAPWDRTVKVITISFVLVCLGISWYSGPVFGLIPVAILILCLAFSVRGYSVVDGNVLVHRPGWSNTFEGAKIGTVTFDPGVMSGSIRTFGIGGLFGYIGHFRNTILGAYRAYATDPMNSVVIKYGDKNIVVTPDRPTEFVATVRAAVAVGVPGS